MSIVDVNGDKLPDIVVGGMLGAHVLTHRKKVVSEAEWREAQPKPRPDQAAADKTLRGPRPAIDAASARVDGALEGESLKVLRASAGQTSVQNMDGFTKDRWSGKQQLFWTGGKPGERLELEFQVAETGSFDVLAAFTMARDYGIINIEIDGKPLRSDIDCYNSPDVISTGELTLGKRELDAGPHTLALVVAGANPAAVRAFMVGLDYVRLQPSRGK